MGCHNDLKLSIDVQLQQKQLVWIQSNPDVLSPPVFILVMHFDLVCLSPYCVPTTDFVIRGHKPFLWHVLLIVCFVYNVKSIRLFTMKQIFFLFILPFVFCCVWACATCPGPPPVVFLLSTYYNLECWVAACGPGARGMSGLRASVIVIHYDGPVLTILPCEPVLTPQTADLIAPSKIWVRLTDSSDWQMCNMRSLGGV